MGLLSGRIVHLVYQCMTESLCEGAEELELGRGSGSQRSAKECSLFGWAGTASMLGGWEQTLRPAKACGRAGRVWLFRNEIFSGYVSSGLYWGRTTTMNMQWLGRGERGSSACLGTVLPGCTGLLEHNLGCQRGRAWCMPLPLRLPLDAWWNLRSQPG